jgi:hypothetical protein
MGKRAILSVDDKMRYVCLPTKNNILVQSSKILPSISLIYEVNSSISQSCVGDIFSEKEVGEQKM